MRPVGGVIQRRGTADLLSLNGGLGTDQIMQRYDPLYPVCSSFKHDQDMSRGFNKFIPHFLHSLVGITETHFMYPRSFLRVKSMLYLLACYHAFHNSAGKNREGAVGICV